jgi:hypothetical protein
LVSSFFTLEKETPKELAAKAYSKYEKFYNKESGEKEAMKVLTTYKDIAKEFMGAYGPVLEYFWQMAFSKQIVTVKIFYISVTRDPTEVSLKIQRRDPYRNLERCCLP